MEISLYYPILCVFENFLKEKFVCFFKKDKAGVQGCKSSFLCLFLFFYKYLRGFMPLVSQAYKYAGQSKT